MPLETDARENTTATSSSPRRSRSWSAMTALAALFAVAAPAGARSPVGPGEPPPEPSRPTPGVSPIARVLFAHRDRTGETLPVFKRSARFESQGELPVIFRARTALDARHEEALRLKGVLFERGGRALASGAYLAWVSRAALDALEADPEITSVAVDLPRNAPRPLDASGLETGTVRARRAILARDGRALDGAGTVIADIDSPIFHFHPTFFRADAGAYRWIDVNGDGELTLDVDGVDLDGDGKIIASEVLHRLESVGVSRYDGATIVKNAAYTPDLDYLYVDLNGNGRRDFGPSFGDGTPGLGEPVFVLDDANHDGRAALSEKVLRLGTSKIKKVRSRDQDYTRGVAGTAGLSAYDPGATPELSAAMGHATGVAGILAGGVPGVSRWLGLAPGAELLVNDGTSGSGTVSAIQWAIDEGANVILTEFAPYTSVSIDGSSEDEQILDAAVDRGIVAVSPAGNLAGGRKHRTISLSPGTTRVALGTQGGFTGSRIIQLSLHYKGAARALGVKLGLPGQQAVDLPESAPNGTPVGTASAYVTSQATRRGTRERFVYLYDRAALPDGAYTLELSLDAGPSLEVEAFVSDELTSWAYGISFDQDTPTRTVCNPATSDKTIPVAAYVLHSEASFYGTGPRGSLATYSSRGPRIDGAAGIAIAAPDNPMSAQPPIERAGGGSGAASEGARTAFFGPFGGTSGAGPHVAAAVALLRQAFPAEPPSRIRERILEGARPESRPDAATTFGRGKLDVARSAGLDIADGPAPRARLVAPARAPSERELTLRVELESTGATFVRWDLDYDGKPDTDWLPVDPGARTAETTITPLLADGPRRDVRVELRDATGQTAADTAQIGIDEAIEEATPPTTRVVEDDGCGCHIAGAHSPARRSAAAGLALALTALLARRARRRAG